jgi:hemerythrin
MPYIEWDPRLETGVAGIDHEHRRLVQLLNDIHELIVANADPTRIADTLADFLTLATAHFALEEKIMRDQKYPAFAQRRETHHRLLDEVRDIMDAYDAGSYREGQSLPATLRLWLFQAMNIDVDLFAKLEPANLRKWGLAQG